MPCDGPMGPAQGAAREWVQQVLALADGLDSSYWVPKLDEASPATLTC